MNSLSTHVLDATSGSPAAGMRITLSDTDGRSLGTGVTDRDGRLRDITGPLP